MGRQKEPMRCIACGHNWFFHDEPQASADSDCDRLMEMECPKCAAGYQFQIFKKREWQAHGAE